MEYRLDDNYNVTQSMTVVKLCYGRPILWSDLQLSTKVPNKLLDTKALAPSLLIYPYFSLLNGLNLYVGPK